MIAVFQNSHSSYLYDRESQKKKKKESLVTARSTISLSALYLCFKCILSYRNQCTELHIFFQDMSSVFSINHMLLESRLRFMDSTGKAKPMYKHIDGQRLHVGWHNTQQEKDVCCYLQHSMGLEATCKERVLPLACGI